MFGRKKRDRWEDDGFPEEEFLTDGTGIYNPITEEDYITKAAKALNAHIIILIIGAALVALRPVYAKMIRSIKTSIEVEDSGNMAAIDISGND